MYTIGICQNGYLSFILKDQEMNINIDDIQYKDDKLYVRGNILLDSIGQFGTFIAELDTLANLEDIHVVYDNFGGISMVNNTPTRFTIIDNNNILLPNKLFQTNTLNFIVLDSLRNIVVDQHYPKSELTIYPFEAFEINGFYYLFGFIQRTNLLRDDYMLKIDKQGNEVWFKYFGVIGANEWLGAVTLNKDKTFTISSTRYTKDYYQYDKIEGWKRPWLYRVDTSGAIIWQWIGDYNDEKTKGGGPFHRHENGNWAIVSEDLIEMDFSTYKEVWSAPTFTLLDSNFNLILKDTLTDFAFYENNILDMEYDPVRQEYILVGDRYFEYDDVESEIWVIKMNSIGEILWEITDTLSYHKSEIHYTAGVEVSNTGSIYVAGYYGSQIPEYHTDGWIMKVTPDGCVDTLCNITSIASDIKTKIAPFSIYPNPAKDILYIRNNDFRELDVQLFNLQGELLFQSLLTGELNSIKLKFPPGMYFIKGINPGGPKHIARFIISN